jgi:hypothetical protein
MHELLRFDHDAGKVFDRGGNRIGQMRAFAAPSAASSVPQSAEAVFDEGGVYLLVLSARRTSDGADLGVELRLSPYAWVPGITAAVDTAWGTVGVDKSSSDLLSRLDIAFMGAFEARNGRWGLIADLFYANLSPFRAVVGEAIAE